MGFLTSTILLTWENVAYDFSKWKLLKMLFLSRLQYQDNLFGIVN